VGGRPHSANATCISPSSKDGANGVVEVAASRGRQAGVSVVGKEASDTSLEVVS
jgi:hypothetical protein